MKRIVASLLMALLALTGCVNTPADSTATTLLSWTRDAGLGSVLQGVGDSIATTAADLKGLGTSEADVQTMVTALKKSGDGLAAQAESLRAQPACSDTEYEKQRTTLVGAMLSYRDTTAALQATDLAGITAAINALTGISEALTAFNKYIDLHGDDPVGAA